MKKLFLFISIFMSLSINSMEAPRKEKVSDLTCEANCKSMSNLGHAPKSLFEISVSNVCNLLTNIDPKKIDSSIHLLKNIIEQDNGYKDIIYSELIERYKYVLFPMYKCFFNEFPEKLLVIRDQGPIMLKNELTELINDNDNLKLVGPAGVFIFKTLTIINARLFVLKRMLDEDLFFISPVNDCLSIKGSNCKDYLLITCKGKKKLVKIGQLCQIAKFLCFDSETCTIEESIVFSLDRKFVLTKSDNKTAIVWKFDLPKLSLEQLILILKLHNLKITGEKLNKLFEHPIFKEIFDKIVDKDEILGSLVKDLELDCAICFEKIDENRPKQKCGHDQFHFACIEQWKEMQNDPTCPICRQEI